MPSAPLAVIAAGLALSAAPTAPNLPEKQPCMRLYTQAKHAHYARIIYRHRSDVTRRAQRRVLRLRLCQHTGEAQTNAKRLTRRLRKAYEVRKSLTPYYCPGHGTKKWYAIECYIVQKESGFNPNADNGSHCGYYQLDYDYGGCGSVAAQDRVAASLWAGGRGKYVHWQQTA